MHNLALAEDVVQDACCRALEVWEAGGVPENPSAWLMATAKNRALDIVRRERTARAFAPEMGRLLETEWTLAPLVDEAFAAGTIRDEQLRMMFSCCHPRLPEEAQLALILNILCGFGAREIASALLTGHAAIEKRIARGKQVLAEARRLFELGDAEFAARLSTVRRALYLLFSEGYHGASAAVGGARRAVRGGAALDGAAAGAPARGDARHRRARRPDVSPRGPASGADRRGRRSERARGAGPFALGRAADRGGARAARAVGRRGRGDGVPHRVGDRRRARGRADAGGDGLAIDRRRSTTG